MAVFDTEENGRSEYTELTIESLIRTVDFEKHKTVIIDNASCKRTKDILKLLNKDNFTIITLSENIGTAGAINMGLKLRKTGENCVKVDNDIVIHQSGWIDEMDEVILREPSIGIIGLKRKDLRQTPYDADPQFRSALFQLSHDPGQRWIIVEVTNDIMGTCTMLSSRLIDTIGGYAQPKCYGFDDSLLNLRAGLAGFKKCFLPHIEIEHLDNGQNKYSQEKISIANTAWPEYQAWHQEYVDGTRRLYEEI